MSIRLAYFFGFLVICFLLLTSVYLQMYAEFIPCPLCVLQRLTFGLIGVLLLIGMLFHKKFWGRMVIHFFIALSSVVGIFLAGRQVWMQHLPSVNPAECGVSLQYMLQALPLNQVLQKVLFEGSTECTKRGWEFLYLNMAEWALVWFVLFLLLALYGFLKEFRWNHH